MQLEGLRSLSVIRCGMQTDSKSVRQSVSQNSGHQCTVVLRALPRTVYLVGIMMDFRHAELSFSSPLKPVKSPKSRGVPSKHHSNSKIYTKADRYPLFFKNLNDTYVS